MASSPCHGVSMVTNILSLYICFFLITPQSGKMKGLHNYVYAKKIT